MHSSLCRHRPEHSLGGKIKLHEIKDKKNTVGELAAILSYDTGIIFSLIGLE